MSRPRRVSRGCQGGVVLLVTVIACSAAPPFADLPQELAAVGLAAELADPVLPDAAMRTWARQTVRASQGPEERLTALLRALLSRPEAPFRHRGGTTTSVQEAWDSGAANCLTFTHLFVRLAREVGVDAYYLRIREATGFDREGDLVVITDHVVAAAGTSAQRTLIDLSARPLRDFATVERIGDRRALALHYSNLGAEAIRAGEIALAGERLAIATRLDAELADGWVNLGVARRRSGDFAGAEAAYRHALAADPEQVSALHNLAALLERLGRGAEARALLAAIDASRLRSPWSALALGGIALRGGRLAEAGRFLRRARRLLPESAEPWAALGEWALARGDRVRARRYAEAALRREPGHPGAEDLLRRLGAVS